MFTLDQVVPWGRSFDEYRRMFALTDAELSMRIIGCGDGPASFNAEATRRGTAVVSCDPIYRYDVGQIRSRIESAYSQILEQTRQNLDDFVWTSIRSENGSLSIFTLKVFCVRVFMIQYYRSKRL